MEQPQAQSPEPASPPPAQTPVAPMAPIGADTPEQLPTPPPGMRHRRMISIAAVVGIIALIVTIVAIVLYMNSSRTDQSDQDQDDEVVQIDPAYAAFVEPKSGETWQEEFEKIEPLGLFTDDSLVVYQIVGKREGRQIIHTYLEDADGNDSRHILFEKTGEDAFTAMLRPQNYDYYSTAELAATKSLMSEKVTAYDVASNYDSLSLPRTVSVFENRTIERVDAEGLGTFPQPSPYENTRQVIKKFGQSTLFRLSNYDDVFKLAHVEYQVESPLGTRMTVTYIPHTLKLGGYTWKNGRIPRYLDDNKITVFDTLEPFSSRCREGAIRNSRIEKMDTADISQVGTSDTGANVYQYVNPSHEFVQALYSQYAARAEAEKRPVDSLEDFINYHAIVLMQDEDASYHVYVRSYYAASYKCSL